MPSNTVQTQFTASNGVSPVLKQIGSSIDGVTNSFSKLNSMTTLVTGAGIASLGAFAATIVGSVTKAVDMFSAAQQAETKLTVIMRQRMGATNQMADSVRNLIAEQTKLGVVGGTAQKSGAQQLATFLTSSEALNTLIPAMNNLAVQQNGYNVTSEAMVGIGNMIGKVMGGQVAALTRVGISLSDADAELLKTLPEQERAALLAKIITQNVGNMNEEFAKTPEGQKVQATMRLNAAWSEMGSRCASAQYRFSAMFAQLKTDALNRFSVGIAVAFNVMVTAIGWAVDGFSWLIGVLGQVADFLAPVVFVVASMAGAFEAASIAVAVYTAAVEFGTAAMGAFATIQAIAAGTTAAHNMLQFAAAVAYRVLTGSISITTAAQWALNLAMNANPIGLVIALVVGLIAIFAVLWARTVGLRQAFASTWIFIVDLIQDSVNICISALNLLIKAMNGAGKLGKTIFNWDYTPVAEVGKVNFQKVRDAGTNAILTKNLEDFAPKMPKVTIPQGGTMAPPMVDPNAGKVADNTGKTAANTARMADAIDMTDAQIADLREMAMRDTLIQWQDSHAVITIQNDNKVSSDVDIDGMTSNMVKGLREALSVTREGVTA